MVRYFHACRVPGWRRDGVRTAVRPFPAWSACAVASVPATGLSLRSLRAATDLSRAAGRPAPAAPALPSPRPAGNILAARPAGMPVPSCTALAPDRREGPRSPGPPPGRPALPVTAPGRSHEPDQPSPSPAASAMTPAPSPPATAPTGVELRLAVELPARVPGGDSITRWVKVTAFGILASAPPSRSARATGSPSLADDLMAEAWAPPAPASPAPGSACGPATSPRRWPSTPCAPATPPARPPALAAANGEPTDLPARSRPRPGSCPASPPPDLRAGAGSPPAPAPQTADRSFSAQPSLHASPVKGPGNEQRQHAPRPRPQAACQSRRRGRHPPRDRALDRQVDARYGIDRALLAARSDRPPG